MAAALPNNMSCCLPLPEGGPRLGETAMYALLSLLYLPLFLLVLFPRLAWAEDYSFDPAEIEKKPYHLGGYIELKPALLELNKDASLYKLKFFNRKEGNTINEYDGTLQLEGSFDYGILRFYGRTNTAYQKSYLGEDQQTTVQEGYFSLKPVSSFKVDAGKKDLNWGKGYAWNPVAFLDRPKDPDDPELNREGYVVLSADYIKSFDGPLKTFTFTPVVLPVYDHVNAAFGKVDHTNLAGKMYLLFYDTDIDLILFSGESKTTRYGLDFSRNLTTNLEIHGEFAFIKDFDKTYIDSTGESFSTTYDAGSFLLGARYLTENDTTYILEYYRNGTGFTTDEMTDYYSFIDKGFSTFLASGNTTLLNKASQLTQGNYGKMNPSTDYLYLRISQKDPFDILYFTPAITLITNLNDRSYSVAPELVSTAVTNLELRLKTQFLAGSHNSEFGEKQNEFRVELRARFYF